MSGTERAAVLIRHSGGGWRAPDVTGYSDEEALEVLLEQTPELLPGPDTGPVAVVRQVYVPETGAVDLFIVGVDGASRLRSNPLRPTSSDAYVGSPYSPPAASA